jgi:DNA-directed RNA polymerase subunit RPC12/RpoP
VNDLPITEGRCGGCGRKRSIPHSATWTACPHCGSTDIVVSPKEEETLNEATVDPSHPNALVEGGR